VCIDPLILAAQTSLLEYAGRPQSFYGPLDGTSLLLSHGSLLADRVHGIIAIDCPYVGSLLFVRAQLVGGLQDLVETCCRGQGVPCVMAFIHTTRSQKWLEAFRPLLREAERLGIGALKNEDDVHWHDSKPPAVTIFTIRHDLVKLDALQALHTLLTFESKSELRATLYRAISAGDDSSSRNIAWRAGDAGAETQYNVRYNTRTTAMSSAGAYRIIARVGKGPVAPGERARDGSEAEAAADLRGGGIS